jgi:hypothetical protein
LSGVEFDVRPQEKFVKMMETLLPDKSMAVPWQKVMPASCHRDFIRKLVDQLTNVQQLLPLNYYRDTWVPGNGVLRSLQRAKVCHDKWERLVSTNVGNVHTVKTFMPDVRGYADPITYDRFGSITGRLTVLNGPHIQTLKREYRNIISSEYGDDGVIVTIDFAALEARILLYEAGRRCEEHDLYGMIAREMGVNITRKAAKAAVISELYGSSKQALGKVLGLSGKELNDFVRSVKSYFGTKSLLKRIKQQFIATGKIVNRYGRHVTIDEPLDHVMINYYAQSTGVDVSLMGFSTIVEMLAKSAPSARPLFILHDGLFLDVQKKHLDQLHNIKHVQVKGYVQKFPVTIEQLS